MKKGQVTLFILIGVVMVAILGLAYMYIPKVQFYLTPTAYTTDYITDCVKLTTENGLLLIGKQGGVVELKEPYFHPIETSIYGERPKEIERLLEEYLERNLETCIQEGDLPVLKIKETGEPRAKIVFTEEDVYVRLDYPLQLGTQEMVKATTQEFGTIIKLRMKKLLEVVDFIIEQDENTLESPLVHAGFEIVVTAIDNIMVYSVIDKESRIAQEPYSFVFAME